MRSKDARVALHLSLERLQLAGGELMESIEIAEGSVTQASSRRLSEQYKALVDDISPAAVEAHMISH